MKFIVDTQLPYKLAVFFRKAGYDCIHTTRFPKGHLLEDANIVKIAINSERGVITKDSDFLDNFNINGSPPKVLYLTFGNISNRDLLSYFEDHLESIISLFENGADFVEFNREGLYIRE